MQYSILASILAWPQKCFLEKVPGRRRHSFAFLIDKSYTNRRVIKLKEAMSC